MRETAAETRAKEKACDFIEECLSGGLSFEQVVNALKWAWVYVHDERAYYARKDSQRVIQP